MNVRPIFQRAGQLLFKDHFEDPSYTHSAWSRIGYLNYEVSGGLLHIMNNELWARLVAGDPSWRDYRVDVDVLLGDDNYARAFFRDTGNYMLNAHLKVDDLFLSLEQIGVGFLNPFTIPELKVGSWYHMRIDCQGRLFRTYYKEGKGTDSLIPVSIYPYRTMYDEQLRGRIGLSATNSWFDNFEIYSLPYVDVPQESGVPPIHDDFSDPGRSMGIHRHWYVRDLEIKNGIAYIGYGAPPYGYKTTGVTNFMLTKFDNIHQDKSNYFAWKDYLWTFLAKIEDGIPMARFRAFMDEETHWFLLEPDGPEYWYGTLFHPIKIEKLHYPIGKEWHLYSLKVWGSKIGSGISMELNIDGNRVYQLYNNRDERQWDYGGCGFSTQRPEGMKLQIDEEHVYPL